MFDSAERASLTMHGNRLFQAMGAMGALSAEGSGDVGFLAQAGRVWLMEHTTEWYAAP